MKNLKPFFYDYLRKEISWVQDFNSDPKNGSLPLKKLSRKESLEMMRTLKWSSYQMRRCKRVLVGLKRNFIAGTNAIHNAKKERCAKLKFIKGSSLFYTSTKLDSTALYPFSKTPSLLEMVKNSLDEFQDREDDLMTLNDKILVAFGGNKGGVGDSAYMKWAYFIVTKNKPQDMANFTTYAMTKAPDFHENMRILHQSYTEDLITLQAEMFLGRRIHTLLVGDLNHISGMIGHQGSSASYPSAFTNVTLEHMAYHPFPHNLESCYVDDRDIATMKIDHALNCVKYPDEARRGGGNTLIV